MLIEGHMSSYKNLARILGCIQRYCRGRIHMPRGSETFGLIPSILLPVHPPKQTDLLGYPQTTSPNIAAAAHVCFPCRCTSTCSSSRSASRPCPFDSLNGSGGVGRGQVRGAASSGGTSRPLSASHLAAYALQARRPPLAAHVATNALNTKAATRCSCRDETWCQGDETW